MTKTEQKQVIKKVSEELKLYQFTIIKPSIFFNFENSFKCLMFSAYDNYGHVANFYIDFDLHYATLQHLSPVVIHESWDVANWFSFEI